MERKDNTTLTISATLPIEITFESTDFESENEWLEFIDKMRTNRKEAAKTLADNIADQGSDLAEELSALIDEMDFVNVTIG